jgi:hypothetical protein
MSMTSRQVLLPGDGLQATRTALLIPLRALQTPTGKRVLAAAALAGVLQAGVAQLYDNADTAELTSTPVAAVAATEGQPGTAAATAKPDAKPAAAPARPAAAPTGKPVKASPEEAAVAFYAAELGLPAERVRPLMQQRVNDHSVRVLVMAERGQEQLPTRLIQVNRTTSGWRVP